MQLTVLFLLKNNQVLLAMKKRGHGTGRWNGVGGKVEPNETVAEAATRECQEEVGVTPRNIEKVAEIEFDELLKEKREVLQVHVFTTTQWEGEPVESEEMAPKWFKFNQIPYDRMWDDDTHWLPLVLAGKKLKAKFVMDDTDMVVSKEIAETTAL